MQPRELPRPPRTPIDGEGVAHRSRDALRAAQMYYLQDLTMDAIARELRTSRSTVSRLLSLARQTGLVQISISNPAERAPVLEQQIRRRFGVEAHVVPVADSVSDSEALERVAIQAARTISPLMDSNAIIGVAWGSTLSAVSHHLTRKDIHDSTIVQLNGAGNTQTTGITYASEILRRFGQAYGARVEQFPVPAFFDHAETKRAMWNERSVRRILDLQHRMTVAVFGVGSIDAGIPSHVYSGGYLDEEDLAQLAEDEVVGDVATMFFREDGSHRDILLNQRSTGPDLDRLREVRRRICVVSGETKINGLRGALAAGLATDLILDEASARRLVQLAADDRPGAPARLAGTSRADR
ncbi:MAG: transcriptional regulator [uncultured Arthrobacter sp.]|uniref:Transcriptional regulator n=2 Tax=uncultured Arthrobacter sp. TaxID=114050 RepID=A0A6J4HXU4_9MICC|nr:MAG: transcriptional regulator [uncultured Arthrobacter sp.]